MSNENYSFRKRCEAFAPPLNIDQYYDAFMAAFPMLDFVANKRKIYFFDQSNTLAQGGDEDSVMIGSYEKNQQFADLEALGGTPVGGEVLSFMKGSKRVYAVIFPALPLPPVVNHYIGMSANIPTSAAQVETLLGLTSGTVTLFTATSPSTIEFNVPIPYSLTAQLTNNIDLFSFSDIEGKQSFVTDYEFLGCMSLVAVNLQGAMIVGRSGFEGCEAMVNGYTLPLVLRVKYLGFYGNLNLQDIDLPECTQLDGESFSYCPNLNNLVFPKVSVIGAKAFEYSQTTGTGRKLEFPMLATVVTDAFLNWGGVGYELTVPTALNADPEILAVAANGTTVTFI